ncbi:class I SAM-dependent methyltransferase [Candidatus Poribacteria bacterium]
MNVTNLYNNRFDANERIRKDEIWRTLVRGFFQKYINATDVVLDMGAGNCEFINHIQCATKVAVDYSKDIVCYADADVQVLKTRSSDLSKISDDSIDVVFASNFFEHLPDKQDFLTTLDEIERVLRSTGRLLILQPNIRLLNGRYWDFLDHHIPLTEHTLVEALQYIGMQIIEIRSRFLPYTTKGRLPHYPWLVYLYLYIRPAQWMFGKQSWIVAVKP